MLDVRGLHKSYSTGREPTKALDGVDVTVERGTFAAVLGPSGSGKSTLLRCIAGFESPDSGTITLAGRTLDSPSSRSVPPHGRGVGVVPQEGALFPHLTVSSNIGYGLAGRSRAQRRERVGQLLELVGLAGLEARRPHQLSGGQQQRVALARALAPEPQVILLDEPFSALDAQLRVDLREEVRALLRKLGTTALLVTHDQAEAMTLADHLVVMRAGRVVASGEPRRIYEAPVDAELGRFLGEAVVLPGALECSAGRTSVTCALGRLDVVTATGAVSTGQCEVLVRPEQVHLTPCRTEEPAGAHDTDAGPGVTGVVVGQSFYGHDALVRVRVQDRTQVAARVSGASSFMVGSQVRIQVRTPVLTFDPGTGPRGSGPALDERQGA